MHANHSSSLPLLRLAAAALGKHLILFLLLAFPSSAHIQSGTDHGLTLPVLTPEPPLPAGLTAQDVPPPGITLPAAPAGAPNILVILLDDVGFAASSTFGGLAQTPTLEQLAQQGLRYNRFHTTGICSPTRASLLTGRNPHAAGVGAVLNSASSYPGYRGMLHPSTATIAEILRQHGYATSAWGKWHLAPDWEISPSGPFKRWPTGVGFDTFYGFLGGETHQYEPTLYQGTTQVRRPPRPDYHLTEDIAERAIAWMRQQHTLRPQQPFFVYFAPGATHAPLHVPKAWIERYQGRFDHGWDHYREDAFARQKRLGVIPHDARLTPRPAQLPAWDTLTADQRRIAARLMETYAAFLAHTDAEIGRLVEALKDMDKFDNTLVFYIVGDNGGSGEGSPLGAFNYFGPLLHAIPLEDDQAVALRQLDEIGSTHSYPQYPAGWAWAMSTPFQWFKTIPSHLGATRNPLVVSWPRGIPHAGGLRSQFAHVNDVVPTILEVVGIAAPVIINGIPQKPMDGTSLLYSFANAAAPERHRTQYFEVFGNRSIYHNGWMASTFRGRVPWNIVPQAIPPFSEDTWELYDLSADFSQSHDLAAAYPDRLRALQDIFLTQAARNDVLPLHDSAPGQKLPDLNAGRTRFIYHAGAAGMPEATAPNVKNRSHIIHADIEIPQGGAHGVLAAEGGTSAGWALYLDAQGRPAYTYNLFSAAITTITGPDPLPAGPASIRLEFVYDGGGRGQGARVQLQVNGTEVASGHLEHTTTSVFSIDETFDIGTDSGSPVGPYPANHDFTGTLHALTVELK